MVWFLLEVNSPKQFVDDSPVRQDELSCVVFLHMAASGAPGNTGEQGFAGSQVETKILTRPKSYMAMNYCFHTVPFINTSKEMLNS